MTPARALITWLTGSGVTLRLDGDAIVHRGPRRVLNPDVLAKLLARLSHPTFRFVHPADMRRARQDAPTSAQASASPPVRAGSEGAGVILCR